MSKTVGDYQLKEKIGKGSYADVYRGVHKVTHQKYAIKTISKDILSEPKLLAGLESEIKIMREFVHENIVCLHEYFSSEKNFYLVLELCEGGDLSKFIKKKKRLDERLAHKFLTQITSGLAFLHEKNFIHRDLKPANVLLSEFSDNAVLKLADFGFAHQLTVASLAQTRCGTPLYMAPEILESKDYDGKADIWSVGCIFYEMLVGTSPFKGTNEGDLLMNIKTKELNVPKDVILSEVSIQILIKLLERNPLRRAALPQLVALCVHMNNNPLPLPVGTIDAAEEVGMPLPLPVPASMPAASPTAGDHKHGELSGSNKFRSSDAHEAPRRRTSSTTSNPFSEAPQQGQSQGQQGQQGQGYSEQPTFISPGKANPRDYSGGPAVGNLRGLFSPMSNNNTNTNTNTSNNTSSPSNANYVTSHSPAAPQEGTASARRSSGTYNINDPQGSKTIRAPYAANPNVNNPNNNVKYPSPSSSPPSSGGGMSTGTGTNTGTGTGTGAGYSMQTLQTSNNNRSMPGHSHNHSHSSTPMSTSPGTIGLMGNLIAYVFNPSPSPTSVMNDSARAQAYHKQQQQQQQQQLQHQHGRSISLDRGTPPNFGNQYGSGTPPPVGGSRARAQGRSAIREDHFTAYTAEQDSMYNGKESSSGLSVDDDFVMINNSSTERAADARVAALNQLPSQQASQANSTSTSNFSANSGGNSAGNSTGMLSGAQPMMLPPTTSQQSPITHHYQQQSQPQQRSSGVYQPYDKESEVRNTEAAAMHAFFFTIKQRCEIYCNVANAIAQLGDQHVRDLLILQQQELQRSASLDGTDDDNECEDDDDEGIAGFVQKPLHEVASRLNPRLRQALLERYTIACSLYSHGASILDNLIRTLGSSAIQIEQFRPIVKMHIDVVMPVFKSLWTRYEGSVKQVTQLLSDQDISPVPPPPAAPIMIQAALQREADGAVEELLGNLNLASKLFASANDLVQGVALVAHDLEDQRKLSVYSQSLMEKHRNCKRRAEELLIFS